MQYLETLTSCFCPLRVCSSSTSWVNIPLSFPFKKEFQIESLQIRKYVTYIRYIKSIFSVEKRNTVMEEDTESKKENGEHPFFLYWRVRLHKPVLRIIIFHLVESLFLISLALTLIDPLHKGRAHLFLLEFRLIGWRTPPSPLSLGGTNISSLRTLGFVKRPPTSPPPKKKKKKKKEN